MTMQHVKKMLKYTESPHPACKDCKHSKEVEVWERMWEWECRLFVDTLGTFSVKADARCKKFERRPDK